ncbi:hypothetical protein BOX15_Mlig005348g1, partial [Macrostomum lignano]
QDVASENYRNTDEKEARQFGRLDSEEIVEVIASEEAAIAAKAPNVSEGQKNLTTQEEPRNLYSEQSDTDSSCAKATREMMAEVDSSHTDTDMLVEQLLAGTATDNDIDEDFDEIASVENEKDGVKRSNKEPTESFVTASKQKRTRTPKRPSSDEATSSSEEEKARGKQFKKDCQTGETRSHSGSSDSSEETWDVKPRECQEPHDVNSSDSSASKAMIRRPNASGIVPDADSKKASSAQEIDSSDSSENFESEIPTHEEKKQPQNASISRSTKKLEDNETVHKNMHHSSLEFESPGGSASDTGLTRSMGLAGELADETAKQEVSRQESKDSGSESSSEEAADQKLKRNRPQPKSQISKDRKTAEDNDVKQSHQKESAPKESTGSTDANKMETPRKFPVSSDASDEVSNEKSKKRYMDSQSDSSETSEQTNQFEQSERSLFSQAPDETTNSEMKPAQRNVAQKNSSEDKAEVVPTKESLRPGALAKVNDKKPETKQRRSLESPEQVEAPEPTDEYMKPETDEMIQESTPKQSPDSFDSNDVDTTLNKELENSDILEKVRDQKTRRKQKHPLIDSPAESEQIKDIEESTTSSEATEDPEKLQKMTQDSKTKESSDSTDDYEVKRTRNKVPVIRSDASGKVANTKSRREPRHSLSGSTEASDKAEDTRDSNSSLSNASVETENDIQPAKRKVGQDSTVKEPSSDSGKMKKAPEKASLRPNTSEEVGGNKPRKSPSNSVSDSSEATEQANEAKLTVRSPLSEPSQAKSDDEVKETISKVPARSDASGEVSSTKSNRKPIRSRSSSSNSSDSDKMKTTSDKASNASEEAENPGILVSDSPEASEYANEAKQSERLPLSEQYRPKDESGVKPAQRNVIYEATPHESVNSSDDDERKTAPEKVPQKVAGTSSRRKQNKSQSDSSELVEDTQQSGRSSISETSEAAEDNSVSSEQSKAIREATTKSNELSDSSEVETARRNVSSKPSSAGKYTDKKLTTGETRSLSGSSEASEQVNEDKKASKTIEDPNVKLRKQGAALGPNESTRARSHSDSSTVSEETVEKVEIQLKESRKQVFKPSKTAKDRQIAESSDDEEVLRLNQNLQKVDSRSSSSDSNEKIKEKRPSRFQKQFRTSSMSETSEATESSEMKPRQREMSNSPTESSELALKEETRGKTKKLDERNESSANELSDTSINKYAKPKRLEAQQSSPDRSSITGGETPEEVRAAASLLENYRQEERSSSESSESLEQRRDGNMWEQEATEMLKQETDRKTRSTSSSKITPLKDLTDKRGKEYQSDDSKDSLSQSSENLEIVSTKRRSEDPKKRRSVSNESQANDRLNKKSFSNDSDQESDSTITAAENIETKATKSSGHGNEVDEYSNEDSIMSSVQTSPRSGVRGARSVPDLRLLKSDESSLSSDVDRQLQEFNSLVSKSASQKFDSLDHQTLLGDSLALRHRSSSESEVISERMLAKAQDPEEEKELTIVVSERRKREIAKSLPSIALLSSRRASNQSHTTIDSMVLQQSSLHEADFDRQRNNSASDSTSTTSTSERSTVKISIKDWRNRLASSKSLPSVLAMSNDGAEPNVRRTVRQSHKKQVPRDSTVAKNQNESVQGGSSSIAPTQTPVRASAQGGAVSGSSKQPKEFSSGSDNEDVYGTPSRRQLILALRSSKEKGLAEQHPGSSDSEGQEKTTATSRRRDPTAESPRRPPLPVMRPARDVSVKKQPNQPIRSVSPVKKRRRTSSQNAGKPPKRGDSDDSEDVQRRRAEDAKIHHALIDEARRQARKKALNENEGDSLAESTSIESDSEFSEVRPVQHQTDAAAPVATSRGRANPTALAERPGIKKDAIEREEQKPNRLEKKSISTTPTNSTPPTIVVRRPRSESLSMEAEPELRFTSSSLGRSKSINLRLDSSYETLYDGNPIEIEAGNNQNDGQESEEADSSSLYEPPPRMLGLEMGDFEYPAKISPDHQLQLTLSKTFCHPNN